MEQNQHQRVAAFNSRLQYVEKTIAYTDMTAAMSLEVDFDAALPDDAFVIGGDLDVTTDFDDGGAGTFKADLGYKTTDTDGLIVGAANNLETIARLGSPLGVLAGAFAGGETPAVTFTSSVNLNTATQGSVTARVYFFRADKLTNLI